MLRSPRALSVVLLLVVACRSQASQRTPDDASVPAAGGPTPSKTMTSEDAVRARAGKDAIVTPWEGAALPGFDLFFLRTRSSADDPATGSGVVYSDGKVLFGPEAMRAVIASGSTDADALAAYASHLLGSGAPPLLDGAGVSAPAAHEALIEPPTLTGTRLEYWTDQPPIGAPELVHTRVDLATLEVVSSSAEKLASPARDAVQTAGVKLAASAFDQREGAEELGALCGDPRVPAILASALATHRVVDTRVAAARAMAGCKDAPSVVALIGALGDGQAQVRKWAAESLGTIGDRSARPALERLAKGEKDPDARISVERALGKLK